MTCLTNSNILSLNEKTDSKRSMNFVYGSYLSQLRPLKDMYAYQHHISNGIPQVEIRFIESPYYDGESGTISIWVDGTLTKKQLQFYFPVLMADSTWFVDGITGFDDRFCRDIFDTYMEKCLTPYAADMERHSDPLLKQICEYARAKVQADWRDDKERTSDCSLHQCYFCGGYCSPFE